MTDTEPEPLAQNESTPRRKGPPRWGVALFLALLVGLVVINHLVQTGGRPVQWIDDDLREATRLAGVRGQRVFLYVYEPNEPIHQRNEREVFSQRWGREALEKAVCCRVTLRPGEVLKLNDGPDGFLRYTGKPLLVLLNEKGEMSGRLVEGGPIQSEFETHIGMPAQTYAARPR
ncbi:MAG: hypothetical protein AB1716_12195 [Planctomycetota bacterium]